MTTITLPPELEDALAQKALQTGSTPESVALDSLREALIGRANPALCKESTSLTMAEFLKDYIGAVASGSKDSGGARMSEDISEKFADGMEEKRRQGKL